jgi:hypothetical protein
MATQRDANNRGSIGGDSAQSRITFEKCRNIFSIITLSDLETFNALPKLKRCVVIANMKLSGLDCATHVMLVWFHLTSRCQLNKCSPVRELL